jgi:hypothetical protein
VTLEEFIAECESMGGGAERANYALFIERMCDALGLAKPKYGVGGELGEYQIDAPLKGGSFRSSLGTGYIDCYRKGHFILEAKQSRRSDGTKKTPIAQQSGQLGLAGGEGEPPAEALPTGYDKLMRMALAQARHYAAMLPADHPSPKFLIVCDVGRAFELYYDYAGNGRGYDYFPDRQSYRIEIPHLRDPAIRERLAAVWDRPETVDPRAASVDITTGAMARLAELSRQLDSLSKAGESRRAGKDAEANAHFIMRLVFCMFAEDTGLLPEGSFEGFVKESINDPDSFQHGLRDLWTQMDRAEPPRFAWAIKKSVRHFNGGLFRDHTAFPLSSEDIALIAAAAQFKWSKAEPAIFGTLFEQALSAAERESLGAHYTPRPYVQRLVEETIMAPLGEEWAAVQAEIEAALDREDEPAALKTARAFHDKLGALRILDPACGTGNFLYVAMELLLRLEGQVMETIEALGGRPKPKVEPHQFLGLELNARAAVIAELVLWIGWLRFRAGNDPSAIPDPVLGSTAAINGGKHGGFDALLLPLSETEPDRRKPMLPPWPEADYIVGNPPFIGGKDIRADLGSHYAETLWASNPDVAPSADLVMHWWDRAARILTTPGTRLKRFGFVTTNSITQEFSRRVIANHLSGDDGKGLSVIFAIPDHPWMKRPRKDPSTPRSRKAGDQKKEKADVRIAMTVAEAGLHDGRLFKVARETALDTDEPKVLLTEPVMGRINSDLRVGSDVTAVVPLKANEGLASPGVKLHGQGFSITPFEAQLLGLGSRPGLEDHIREYRNGKDIVQASRGRMVIDLFGLTIDEVRQRFPEVYDHVAKTVRPERETNNRETYRKNWWTFGEPRSDLRPALAGLPRYIATVETAKHRIFQFLDGAILPDNMIVAIATDSAFHMGVLQSRHHVDWAMLRGGTLEDRPRYNKSLCFDPFPFPVASPAQETAIANKAQAIEAQRKLALVEALGASLTDLYNVVRDGEGALEKAKRTTNAVKKLKEGKARRTLVAHAGILRDMHGELDALVAEAYGWPTDLSGEEIVTRLVALNAERAAEEAAGKVRWLRPDYQAARYGG